LDGIVEVGFFVRVGNAGVNQVLTVLEIENLVKRKESIDQTLNLVL